MENCNVSTYVVWHIASTVVLLPQLKRTCNKRIWQWHLCALTVCVWDWVCECVCERVCVCVCKKHTPIRFVLYSLEETEGGKKVRSLLKCFLWKLKPAFLNISAKFNRNVWCNEAGWVTQRLQYVRVKSLVWKQRLSASGTGSFK